MATRHTGSAAFLHRHSASWLHAFVVLALGALAAQCLLAMRVKSVTFDEPFYLSAGYAYLTEGRFELNREHPPLMKYLIGLPLLFRDLRPLDEFAEWAIVPQKRMAFGAWFLFENRADPDAMLFWSRIPALMLSLGTGLLVWLWSRSIYGPVGALMALWLYCLCPNIIAHSGLATLDLGVTAGVFAAAFTLWRWWQRPGRGRMIVAGLALAAALLMKFSAIVVLGLVPVCLVGALLRGAPGTEGLRDRGAQGGKAGGGATRAKAPAPKAGPRARARAADLEGIFRLARTILGLGGILLTAALLVACAYGPSRFGLAEYARGFDLGVLRREKLTEEAYQSFCWGRYSISGFWYYHLAAFLIKTPLPLLLLAVATVGRWVWQRKQPAGASGWESAGRRGLDEWFLIVPAAVTFLITMPIQKNFGLRNVLPAYPFIIVLAGGTAAWIWNWSRHNDRRGKPGGSLAGKAIVVALGIWSAVGALRIHPDQISYFNELVGGPSRGIYYLDDSNIDWGQDLKQLAAYVTEHDIRGLKLYYFGSYFLKPAARRYGLEFAPMNLPQDIRSPVPGWYAVSAHLLQRPQLFKTSEVRFDWLDRFQPQAIIGHSIYVYRF